VRAEGFYPRTNKKGKSVSGAFTLRASISAHSLIGASQLTSWGRLAVSNFCFSLHDYIHKDTMGINVYDHSVKRRKPNVIAAKTFGALV
jgi:hypothetical protein